MGTVSGMTERVSIREPTAPSPAVEVAMVPVVAAEVAEDHGDHMVVAEVADGDLGVAAVIPSFLLQADGNFPSVPIVLLPAEHGSVLVLLESDFPIIFQLSHNSLLC